MKKKIIISVVSVIVILVGIVAYFVAKDLKQEEELLNEVTEIASLFDGGDKKRDKLELLLNRTITSGDYLKTELALKNYVKDFLNMTDNILEVVEADDLNHIITTKNFSKDGPDFVYSKKYVNDCLKKLESYKKDFLLFFQDNKIMSYIESSLDEYYLDFYRDELIGEVSDPTAAENSIDSFIKYLTIMENILDLLANDPDDWYVDKEEEVIYFYSDDNLNAYKNYLKELDDLDFSNENI